MTRIFDGDSGWAAVVCPSETLPSALEFVAVELGEEAWVAYDESAARWWVGPLERRLQNALDAERRGIFDTLREELDLK